MRRLLLVCIPVFFILPSLHAQSYNSNLVFQKNRYAVASLQLPYEEDVVTAAIRDYMSRKGFKDSRYKDFVVFRSMPLDSSRTIITDGYFDISRKSRSEKDLTILSLLPVKKDQPLLAANVEDSAAIGSAIIFLNNLKPFILDYGIQHEIITQQEAVGKAQSKFVRLKNDSGDIAKKMRGYESDLQQNKIDQDKESREILKTATGDNEALEKEHKKMGKLLDKQADLEKKLRNTQSDAYKNNKDLETQQNLVDKENQALNALKLKQQNQSANR